MLGHLDKKFSGGGGGWWHCNYSFKLQGSRGDLESLPLVELDSRPRVVLYCTVLYRVNDCTKWSITITCDL